LKDIDVSKLVLLDESSINPAFSRNYGRAPKNEHIKEGRIDVRFQRKSILSAMPLNGEFCPFVFSGTLNKELFSGYIEKMLKPVWNAEDILLLDNSSVHHSKLVIETLEKCEVKYLFLPPYSPDFNPIELLWTKIKSVLKKFKARTHEKLEEGIAYALKCVNLEFVTNWFRHCGYSL
jgi:transposase